MSKQPRTATWAETFADVYCLWPPDARESIGVIRLGEHYGWRCQWRNRSQSAPITLREAVRRIEAWAARERITITNPGMPIEEAGK